MKYSIILLGCFMNMAFLQADVSFIQRTSFYGGCGCGGGGNGFVDLPPYNE